MTASSIIGFSDIDVCVFDAYGTLFDINAPVADLKAREPRLDAKLSQLTGLWRQKQLEYTWLRSLMGQHADFWTVTVDALDYAIATLGGLPDGVRDQLLALYAHLSPYPDAVSALDRLLAAGLPRAILSNGAEAMLASAIQSAGFADKLDAVLSVDRLGVYKPHPTVYHLVVDAFSTAPERVLFFSSNGWDVAGAGNFGFRTVWVNRFGLPVDNLPNPPRHIIPSLAALFD